MTRRRSVFRPCIDLHDGKVKQIVGGTLSEDAQNLKTNFVARNVSFNLSKHIQLTHDILHSESPSYFAGLYKKHGLVGGHVIKLGPGNEEAAKEALAAWPQGLQIGGGIDNTNAQAWLNHGASKVIVTSFLFPSGKFSLERIQLLSDSVGKDKLVVDLSCRRRDTKWIIAMNKWQVMTDLEVCKETLDLLSQYCSEFLIHAADVEGLCNGIDDELVSRLGQWVTIPTTYAGGANDITDLNLVDQLSGGRIDLTYGSALDIFGGTLVKFEDLVHRTKQKQCG